MPARTISRKSVDAPGFVRFWSGRSRAVFTRSRNESNSVRRYVLSRSQRAICVAKPIYDSLPQTRSSRCDRAAQRLERGDELVGPRDGGQLEGLDKVVARVLPPVAAVGDVRERAQHGGPIGPARSGHVERFAQDPVGVAQLPAPGESLAELATEDEQRAHRVVELATEKLAARELEGAAQGHDRPLVIATGGRGDAHSLEEHEGLERRAAGRLVQRSHLDRHVALVADRARGGVELA